MNHKWDKWFLHRKPTTKRADIKTTRSETLNQQSTIWESSTQNYLADTTRRPTF